MSDIGLLVAGVLTTGQPSVNSLPQEPAIQPDNVIEDSQNQEQEEVPQSPKIASPEFALPEMIPKTVVSELTQKQKNILNKIRKNRELEVGNREDIGDKEVKNLSPIRPNFADKNLSPTSSRQLPQTTSGSPSLPGQKPTSVSVCGAVACDSALPVGVLWQEKHLPSKLSGATGSPLSTLPSTEDGMSKVTSVSQLDDVESNSWAFSALQSLVERYGCIAGYPDSKFKGNRAMTRYEFAAGLSACMDKISELIATGTENLAKKEDLVTLQRLQTEFQTELKKVQARVDKLEERSAQVQANQFSTTTKLFGQAILSVQGNNEADIFLYRGEEQPRKAQTNTTLTYSSQLTFATSFTGRDLLLTGLAAGNLDAFTQQVSTNMGRLAFESDTGKDLVLNELSYRFPVSDNLGVVVGTAGVNPANTFRGINPLEGSGEGAISLFGQRNPILAIGSGTGGVGLDWQISDRVSLQAVYSAQIPSFPGDVKIGGLFGGNYTAGTQLTVAPTDNLDIGIHYLFSHTPDGNLRTGIGDTQLNSPFVPYTAFDTHAVGTTIAWRVNENLQIGGWGGWTSSDPVDLPGTVETTNWAVFAAFPNLFRPGNLGGVLVGQPPKITSSNLPDGYNLPNFAIPNFETGGGAGGREDTSLHLELFYRAQINDNISLTPGVFLIFNPNHNADNDTLIVGAMRATFRF